MVISISGSSGALGCSKIARGRTHDLDAVETLHAHHPLGLETLLERFGETSVEGSRTDFEISFILTVERLYGSQKAQDVERQFQRDRSEQGS
ncbi:MAG: hypothetical protein M3Y59_00520 [Myxococcota bacterium]|nr:hypothetical protein [Myxococcota bacterium]